MDGARAHVFVADLDELALEDGDVHHLGRVLRLRVGEPVTACDGAGGWRPCVVAVAGGGVRLEPAGAIVHEPQPQPVITIGFALTKGDKPELAVQKLTEAGVDVIAPFIAERSVVRWDDDKAERNHRRFETVAREAAMQSRRTRVPTIHPVRQLSDVLAELAASPGGVARAERGGAPPGLDHPCVLVGPEGGWSDAERELGLPTVSVGDQVFRAETAAVASGVLLCALRGGLVSAKRP